MRSDIFGNYLFTIASAPNSEIKPLQPSLLYLARAHSGFTRRLAEASQQSDTTVRAWVEGPYGGLYRTVDFKYDSGVLVAGGAGITACLPWVQHCVTLARSGETSVQSVSLVWAIKQRAHWQCAATELLAAATAASKIPALKSKVSVSGTEPQHHEKAAETATCTASDSNATVQTAVACPELNRNSRTIESPSLCPDSRASTQEKESFADNSTDIEFLHGRPEMRRVLPPLVIPASRVLVICKFPWPLASLVDKVDVISSMWPSVSLDRCCEHLRQFAEFSPQGRAERAHATLGEFWLVGRCCAKLCLTDLEGGLRHNGFM